MECIDFHIATTSASVCNRQDSKEGNGLGGLLWERHPISSLTQLLENHRHTVPGFWESECSSCTQLNSGLSTVKVLSSILQSYSLPLEEEEQAQLGIL